MKSTKSAIENTNYAIVIAESGGTFVTEYDGQVLELCFFCDANIWDGEEHNERCAYIMATKTNAWKSVLEDSAKREEKKRRRSPQYLNERVACINCGRYITRRGMNDHINAVNCSKTT